MKKLWVLAGVGLLCWGGCQTPKGPTFDPRESAVGSDTNVTSVKLGDSASFLTTPTNIFTLGPGDKLEIEIHYDSTGTADAGAADPTTKSLTTVGPDGKIYFYLLPGIDVWGMTLSEARNTLEKELAKYDKSKPTISITLRGVESKRFWVLGRVTSPGIYPMSGPTTLLEAVTMAGGTTRAAGSSEDSADLRHSFLIRDGKVLPVDFSRLFVQGDMSQNVYLQPDDFVYFPSLGSKSVYLLGALGLPQALPFREDLSLISAIATAGGPMKGAHLSQVALVRGSLTEPKVAIVNYKDIISGKTTNVRLEAGDIVYIPYSPFRNLTKYANLIVETFVSAMAINEGARAASQNAPNVGVNIGIGGATAAPAVGVGVAR